MVKVLPEPVCPLYREEVRKGNEHTHTVRGKATIYTALPVGAGELQLAD